MFSIEFSRRAEKDLKNLGNIIAKRVLDKIQNLSEDPFPNDAIKLKGEGNVFRIRVGKYRVLYEVYHENRVVLISKIDKRERVYD